MSVTLSFGKHRNKPLSEVPSGYLRWLQEQGIKSGALRAAVEAELAKRPEDDDHGDEDRDHPAPAPSGPTRDPVELALEKLEQAVLLLRAARQKRGAA